MAVVFISPKQRQKMFFTGITIMFLLVLIVISFVVFLAGPAEVSPVLVFNKPKVNIDMKFFDSDQFLKLQPFNEMETQYKYTGTNKANQVKTGFISAISIDEARNKLENAGLTVTELRQLEIGRANPFIPYYGSTAATSSRSINQ